jgi:CRISPR/Cas system-associated exonuclease Cas4 (RecB family)
MAGPITAWSFSRLLQFEKCPHSLELSAVRKLPKPVQAEDNPMARGNRIHKLAEDYVSGKIEAMPNELSKQSDLFKLLREEFTAGTTIVEEDWGFDLDWAPTGWFDDDVWNRSKCDVVRTLEGGRHVHVIDWKTGKKHGNEVKHIQQGQLYAVCAAIKYPDAVKITSEIAYLDHNVPSLKKTYTREILVHYMSRFTERGLKLTNATQFPPKPNAMNCKYCDYGEFVGTGACDFRNVL